MRIFNNKRHSLIALAVVAGAIMVPAIGAIAGYGPNRPTFTMANPAPYNTFNSITDNPVVGDERPFLTVRDATAATNTYADTIAVSDNQELVLRVYFHNNAGSNLNLVAHNTRVKLALPPAAGTSQESIAYISADNANPTVVTDTANFTGTQPFTLEYEAGSARLRTNALNDVALSDSIVTSSGAPIGYSAVNGDVPGCLEFSGWVTVKVRVHVQPTVVPPSCNLLNLTANPGRKVDANVTYTATGGATLKTVTFDWGDGSTPLVTTNTSASYTFAKDGTYTVKSTLLFNVGGTDQSTFCTRQVTFTTPPVTPPTVNPPVVSVGKSLPNTGPGSVAAIFAGVSAIAGAGHYFVTRRVRQ